MKTDTLLSRLCPGMWSAMLVLWLLLWTSNGVFAQSGSLDITFDPGPGANNAVRSVAVQPDGKILIAGAFTGYGGNDYIARLNPDGTLDPSFNVGTNLNNNLWRIALQIDGKIIIAGDFTMYGATPRSRVARLNADGSLDGTFAPGTGADGTVYAAAVQGDGKILIGGAFNNYNATLRRYVARLNADGSLDGGFNAGIGFNILYAVDAITIQTDNQILIGGSFALGGSNNIQRLDAATGASDATFIGTGTNAGIAGLVQEIVQEPGGNIIVAGNFTICAGSGRNRIARLLTDGTIDATFNPGTGANNTVYAVALQPDGKIIIGGDFGNYNATPRGRLARIDAGGNLDLGFIPPGAGVNNTVRDIALQIINGKIILGGAFTDYGGTARNRIARLNVGVQYLWTGAPGADWTLSTNWMPVRSAPQPDDIITFPPGHNAPDNVPTETVDQILFSAYSEVVLRGSAPGNFLTILSPTTIISSARFHLGDIPEPPASNPLTLTVQKRLTVQGALFTSTASIQGPGDFTLAANAVLVAGGPDGVNGVSPGTGAVRVAGTISYDPLASYGFYGNTSLLTNFAAVAPNKPAITQAHHLTATVGTTGLARLNTSITLSGKLTVSTSTMEVDMGSTLTLNGGGSIVQPDATLRLKNGTVTNAGGLTIAGGGILEIEDAGTFAGATPGYFAASALRYNVAGPKNSGIELPTPTMAGAIIKTGMGVATLAAGVTINGQTDAGNGLEVYGGMLKLGAGTTTVMNKVSISPTNTLDINGQTLVCNGALVTIVGSLVRGSATSNVTLNGNAGQTLPMVNGFNTLNSLTVNIGAANVLNITVNAAVNPVLTVGTPGSGTLTLQSGTVTSSPSALLRIGNDAPGAIVAVSGYVTTYLERLMLPNITADGTDYLYPLGLGPLYRPAILKNVRIGAAAPVVGMDIFPGGATTVTGAPDPLSAIALGGRNWYVGLVSGNFNSSTLVLGEPGLPATDRIGKSAAQAGSYTDAGGGGVTAADITSNPQEVVPNNYYAIATASAPQSYTWNVAAGLWTTPASWSPVRTTPLTTDVLIFPPGVWSATGVPNETVSRLIVQSGANAALQAAAPLSVVSVIGNGTPPAIDVQGGGGILNLNAALGALVGLAVPSGQECAVSGVLRVGYGTTGAVTGAGNFTLAAGGVLSTARSDGFNGTSPATGAVQVAGTITYNPLGGYGIDCHSPSMLNLAAVAPNKPAVAAAQGLKVSFPATVTATLNTNLALSGMFTMPAAATVGDFQITGGANLSWTGAGSSIADGNTLNLVNGSVNNAGGLAVNGTGRLMIQNAGSFTGAQPVYANTASLVYNVTAPKTSNLELATPTMPGQVIKYGAGAVTLTAGTTFDGAGMGMDVQGGALLLGGTSSVTNQTNIAAGALLDLNNYALACNGLVTGTGQFVGSLNAGLTLNGAGNQTIQFQGGTNSLKDLTVNVGASNSLTITGGVIVGTVGSGTLSLQSGAVNTTVGANFLQLGNNQPASLAVTGGYVYPSLERALLPSIAANGTNYYFPVNNSAVAPSHPLTLKDVRTGAGAPAVRVTYAAAGATTFTMPLTAGAFSAQNWFVQDVVAGLINSTVVLDAGVALPVNARVGMSAAQAGSYLDIGGGPVAGNTVESSALTLSPNNYLAVANGPATYTWAGGGMASWAAAASWTPMRTTPNATDILIFNTPAPVLATNVPTETIGQLFIQDGPVTLHAAVAGNTLSIGGNLGSDVVVAPGKTLTLDDGSSLPVNITMNGGTLCDVAGELNTGSGSVLNGAGDFTLQAGAKLSTANSTGVAGTIVVTGVETFNAAASYRFFGTMPLSMGFIGITSVNNLEVQMTGVSASVNTTPLSIGGALSVLSGYCDIAPGMVVTLNGAGSTVQGGASIILYGNANLQNTGGLTMQAGSALIMATNLCTVTGTPVLYQVGSRIQYSGVGNIVTTNVELPNPMNGDVYITKNLNTDVVTLNASKTFNGWVNVQTGTLSCTPSTAINFSRPTGAPSLTLGANGRFEFSNLCNVQINDLQIMAGGEFRGQVNANLTLNGPILGNVVFTAGLEALGNLTLNIGMGNMMILQSPLGLGGTLTLMNGLIQTDAVNILSILGSGAGLVVGGSTTSYIIGPFRRDINGAGMGNYLFPVGKLGQYLPFTLNNPTANPGSFMTVEAFNTNSMGVLGTGVGNLNTTEYWSSTVTGTWSGGQVTLTPIPAPNTSSIVAVSPTVNGTYATAGGTLAAPAVQSTALSSYGSPQFYVAGTAISTQSDIIPSPGFAYPTSIPYILPANQGGDVSAGSVTVFSLRIRDGSGVADPDVLPTILSQLVLSINDPNAVLNRVALYDATGTTELLEQPAGATVTFAGLGGAAVTAADDGFIDILVKVTFQSTVTDLSHFEFTVGAITQVAAMGSSGFAAMNAGGAQSSTVVTDNKINVVASNLVFLQQPSNVLLGFTMMPAPVLHVVDGNGNIDLDVTTISLSNAKLNASPVSVAVMANVATFNAVTFNGAGMGETLTASATVPGVGIINTVSDPFTITNSSASKLGYSKTDTAATDGISSQAFLSASTISVTVGSFSVANLPAAITATLRLSVAPLAGSTATFSISGTTEATFSNTYFVTLPDVTITWANAPLISGSTIAALKAEIIAGTMVTPITINLTISTGATPPSISSISPIYAGLGQKITIVGDNFYSVGKVTFGGKDAQTFTVVSPTKLEATLANGSTGEVQVITPGGIASSFTATTPTTFEFAPPPQISSFTPTQGFKSSLVQITGKYFRPTINLTANNPIGLYFGGTAASNITINNDTTMTVVIGNGSSGEISLTTLGGSVQTAENFTFVSLPIITSYSPTIAGAGTMLTMTGANFSHITSLAFNGVTTGVYTIISPTEMKVTIPQNAQSGALTLSNIAGSTQASTSFTFAKPPAIDSVSQTVIPVGGSVLIYGQNFYSGMTATFDSLQSPLVHVISPTQALVYVPQNAPTTKATLTITSPGGSATFLTPLQLLQPPRIDGATPLRGGPGTFVTITGANFVAPLSVHFGGITSDSVVVVSDKEVRASVSRQGATGNITLRTDAGLTTGHLYFFIPPPSVTVFDPVTGTTGATVVISGSGFTDVEQVFFGSLPAADFVVDSPTQITAIVSTGATGVVTVKSKYGSGSSVTNFVFFHDTKPPKPFIISFTPTEGESGTEIVINGLNLHGIKEVLIGGAPAAFVIVHSPLLITAVVGDGATGKIQLTTFAGSTTSSKQFTYLLPPVVGLTPLQQDSTVLARFYNNNNGKAWKKQDFWLQNTIPVSQWYGVTVENVNGEERVVALELQDNNIQRTLPSYLSRLGALRRLNLRNNQIGGFLSSSFATLSNLTELNLGATGLSAFPDTLSPAIKILSLDSNKFTGSFPLILCRMPNLEEIQLSANGLSGELPECVVVHKKLQKIWLQNNKLSGFLPQQLFQNANLKVLSLAGNNFSGVIPDFPVLAAQKHNHGSVLAVSGLEILDLSYNQLSGTLPSSIWKQSNLRRLNLSGNTLTANVSSDIKNLALLEDLQLVKMGLSGSFPSELQLLRNLRVVCLDSNSITGVIPSLHNTKNLQELGLSWNKLDSLPNLDSLPQLTKVRLQGNRLNFASLEHQAILNQKNSSVVYSPQDSIGTGKDTTAILGRQFQVVLQSSGNNNTFRWYKQTLNADGKKEMTPVELSKHGKPDFDQSSLQFTSFTKTDTGLYSCRVTNKQAPNLTLWSRSITLHSANPAPPVIIPQLITPAQASGNISVSTLFRWSLVSDASHYELLFSTKESFQQTDTVRVPQPTKGTAVEFKPPQALAFVTTYYWKVRPVNEGGKGTWSNTGIFTTLAQGAVLTVSGVNFGRVLVNELKTDTLTLTNLQEQHVTVQNLEILSNPEEFSFVDTFREIVLNPGQTIPIAVKFSPKAKAGNRDAGIKVSYSFSGGATNTQVLQGVLVGRSGTIKVIGGNFDTVRVGKKAETTVSVVNVDTKPLKIRDVALTSNQDAVFALAADGIINRTLQPNNDTTSFLVSCTAKDSIRYSGSYRVTSDLDTADIPLSAIATAVKLTDLFVTVGLRADRQLVEPGDTVGLELYIRPTTPDTANKEFFNLLFRTLLSPSFNTTVRYNSSVLQLDKSGFAASLIYDSTTKTSYQKVSSSPAWSGKEALLLKIPTKVALGSTDKTDLYLDRFEWAEKPSNVFVTFDNTSQFVASVCKIDGTARLIGAGANKTSILSLFPNPANDETSLTYSLREQSPVQIELFDMQGKKVGQVYTGYHDAGEYRLTLRLSSFSPGLYSLRLSTPTRQEQQQFMIYR